MTIHGGAVAGYARALGCRPEDIVDFSANINPLGPPAHIINAMKEAFGQIKYYPDAAHHSVKRVLSERFAQPTDRILCGNGATEVMELLMRHIAPARVVIVQPAFSEYAAIARRLQIPLTAVHLDGGTHRFKWPAAELAKSLRPGDLLIFNQPHNPTGCVWPVSAWLDSVRQWCAQGIHILIDESFIDFLPDERNFTALPHVQTLDKLYIVRSATKMYAIPGLRFGFGFANPAVVEEIESLRDGWSVNQLALAAAEAAYQDERFTEVTKQWLRQEQTFIARTWGGDARIQTYSSAANFFLVRFERGEAAEWVQACLRAQRMFIRSCSDFSGLGRKYARVAIRSRVENERLWSVVSESLNRFA